MDFFKRKLVTLISEFLKVIANWKAPWVKAILTAEQIDEILEKSQPGDILLVRAGGYFSTFLFWLFRLGRYSHCVFVSDIKEITDSTAIGVTKRSVLSVLIGYTDAVILRPKLQPKEWARLWSKYAEVMEKDADVGIAYNFELIEDGEGKAIPDELTCAQLIRILLNAGCPDYMDLRKRFGFLTVSPQDFYLAKKKFDVIKKFD